MRRDVSQNLEPKSQARAGSGYCYLQACSGPGCGCTVEPFVVLEPDGVHQPDCFRAHFLNGKLLPPGGQISPKQTGPTPPNLEHCVERPNAGEQRQTIDTSLAVANTIAPRPFYIH